MNLLRNEIDVGISSRLREIAGLEAARRAAAVTNDFSLQRMLDSLATRGLLTGCPEAEIAQEAARAGGSAYDPMRPTIPWGALARDLVVGTPSGGGYLVSTTVGPAALALRPWSVTVSAGMQVFEGLVGTLSVPKIATESSVTWHTSEAHAPAGSQPVLGAVAMSPKICSVNFNISRQLLLQSPQADAVLRQQLLRTLGRELDRVALNGSGASGEPTGLLTLAGTQVQSGTTLGIAAAANMLEQCVTNGATDENIIFVAAPPVRELLQTREAAAGSGFVWSGDTVVGRRGYATATMPVASMVGGDFSNMALSLWGAGLQVEVDPSTGFKSGTLGMRIIVGADVGCLFPAAFCKATSIT